MIRSTMSSLRRGVQRSAAAIGGGLRSLLHGRNLDLALIEQLESTLVASDVGVVVARELVEAVREQFRAGTATTGRDAVSIVKQRLKQRLSGDDLKIARAASGPTVILVVGVNGSGKTTSVAKIAHVLQNENRDGRPLGERRGKRRSAARRKETSTRSARADRGLQRRVRIRRGDATSPDRPTRLRQRRRRPGLPARPNRDSR